MILAQSIEAGLNRFVRPEVRFAGRSLCSFHVCGVTGFSAGVATALLLDWRLGLSPWVTLAIAASGAATFFALAMAFKIVTGREELIYYHHEIAVVSVAALLLHFLPVRPESYLDQTVLGVGVMLMFGRIGCLMAGCCHGYPARWGICYRPEHARAGFPGWLVGVRLFPVQLVEALALIGILGATFWLVATRPPGDGLAFYVAAYALLRFCLEFLRGDTGRPSLGGFSEAQWTSLALCIAAGTVFAGCRSVAILLAVAMAAISLIRWRLGSARGLLLEPRHVREIAEALSRVARPTGREARVESTSLGIRLSCGEIAQPGGRLRHYSISSLRPPMALSSARTLARLILRLRHSSDARCTLISGAQGVFHMLASDRESA